MVRPAPGRHLWVQVISGEVELAGRQLTEGDGAAIGDLDELTVTGRGAASDLLLFDLA